MKVIFCLILMEMSSAIMYASAIGLYRIMQRKNSRWYYAMQICAVCLLILPIQEIIKLPKLLSVSVSEKVVTTTQAVVTPSGITMSEIIFGIWLTVAVLIGLYVMLSCCRTKRMIFKWSSRTNSNDIKEAYRRVAEDLGINRYIELRISDKFSSPMLMGIIKPVIVIPDVEWTEKELDMIMYHELTHYKHCDLFIKLLASISVCIHWFNPVSYMLSKSLSRACELCCDESVIERLGATDKKDYGRLIIAVIERQADKTLLYTTAMASTEKGIKRRLKKIAEYTRPSLIMKLASAMLCATLLLCSVTALGVELIKKTLPEDAVHMIDRIENMPIAGNTQPETEARGTVSYNGVVQYRPENITQGNTDDTTQMSGISDTVTQAPAEEATPHPAPVKPQITEPPYEPERTKSVRIDINKSVNFDGEEINSENTKQINANASSNTSSGRNMKAYVRVNEDGTYDLMYSR